MALPSPTPVPRIEETVTWIAVEHPKLDVVGLVLGAFRTAGFFIVVALLLGVIFGVGLIRKRRREPDLRPQLDLIER